METIQHLGRVIKGEDCLTNKRKEKREEERKGKGRKGKKRREEKRKREKKRREKERKRKTKKKKGKKRIERRKGKEKEKNRRRKERKEKERKRKRGEGRRRRRGEERSPVVGKGHKQKHTQCCCGPSPPGGSQTSCLFCWHFLFFFYTGFTKIVLTVLPVLVLVIFFPLIHLPCVLSPIHSHSLLHFNFIKMKGNHVSHVLILAQPPYATSCYGKRIMASPLCPLDYCFLFCLARAFTEFLYSVN